jgi:hypothetical protein
MPLNPSESSAFRERERRKYYSYPTPMYDKMLEEMKEQPGSRPGSKGDLKYECSKENTDIFWKYLDKIGREHFEDPKGSSQSGVGITPAQAFCFTSGLINSNYLIALQTAERNKLYGYGSANNLIKGYQSVHNLVGKKSEKYKRNQSRKKQIERNRYSKVKTGNLLGLKNKRNDPNLLTFGPTEEGMKSRGNELEGLFGGKRRTRKRKV